MNWSLILCVCVGGVIGEGAMLIREGERGYGWVITLLGLIAATAILKLHLPK